MGTRSDRGGRRVRQRRRRGLAARGEVEEAGQRTVAILIAGSPTRAFYSQVAALSLALSKLEWSAWRPQIHLYMGGEPDNEAHAEWLPHLPDIEIAWVSPARFEREGDWAQSDDVFSLAPRHADVLIAMDADVLPVAGIEHVLERVADRNLVAATIAHKPFPGARDSPRESWSRATDGLIDEPLEFKFPYTLMRPSDRGYHLAPFYPNFAVVLFSRAAFADIVPRYLSLRPKLMDRMDDPDFTGQVALTLAITSAGARTWAMPMRYNLPNDPIVEQMYPSDVRRVAMLHYLRTRHFDRHKIFASADEYSRFLDLPLSGVNRVFQRRVRRMFGPRYPFG